MRKRVVKYQPFIEKTLDEEASSYKARFDMVNRLNSQANPDVLSDELQQQVKEKNNEDKEKLQIVFDAINRGVLSANEVFIFKMLSEGLTKTQIGAKLRKSAQEINMYHTRLQKKLRKLLRKTI